jgi:hypothetical protein
MTATKGAVLAVLLTVALVLATVTLVSFRPSWEGHIPEPTAEPGPPVP